MVCGDARRPVQSTRRLAVQSVGCGQAPDTAMPGARCSNAVCGLHKKIQRGEPHMQTVVLESTAESEMPNKRQRINRSAFSVVSDAINTLKRSKERRNAAKLKKEAKLALSQQVFISFFLFDQKL